MLVVNSAMTSSDRWSASNWSMPCKVLAVAAGGAAAVAGAWYIWRQNDLCIHRNRRKVLLASYRSQMLVPVEQLQEIRDEFQRQLEVGLLGPGADTEMMMLPTMVDVLPTGYETGTFFAIDWGGTNFRVVCITLSKRPHKVGEVEMKSYFIEDSMKRGPVENLYDVMAQRMVEFAVECGESVSTPEGGERPVVGFCFSFPVMQTALNAGSLIEWTKGFTLTGAVGADPVLHLSEAFERRGSPVQVRVLINDTTGVLAAGRFLDPSTMVGVILGTGTNACYVEQASRVHTLPAGHVQRTDQMCVNTEWGNFKADCLPRMQEDMDLDAESTNVGKMHFEKLVSGMYIGEVACRMMLKVAREGQLFGGRVPDELHGPVWPCDASFVARIHADETFDLSITGELLHETFGYEPCTLPFGARRNVKEICKLAGQRGATLMAAALSGIVRHMGRDIAVLCAPSYADLGAAAAEDAMHMEIPLTTIAVDGSMFLKYDKFKAAVVTALGLIAGKEVAARIRIKNVEDGSSVGAACLASAAGGS